MLEECEVHLTKFTPPNSQNMNNERREFLIAIREPPARLSVEETAWYLGFAIHDIPILVKCGLLKPLGRPPPNAVKYFAAVDLAALREDSHWLSRASEAVIRHWQNKNARRTLSAHAGAHSGL